MILVVVHCYDVECWNFSTGAILHDSITHIIKSLSVIVETQGKNLITDNERERERERERNIMGPDVFFLIVYAKLLCKMYKTLNGLHFKLLIKKKN